MKIKPKNKIYDLETPDIETFREDPKNIVSMNVNFNKGKFQ